MFLLVANCEFALCLLIVLRKIVELLDSRARRNRGGEFDVCFGVFVAGLEGVSSVLAAGADINVQQRMDSGAYIDFSIVRKSSEGLVEGSFHLLRCTFDESPAAAVEESVACEDSFVFAVLHEPADAVLRVARCVYCFHGDTADVEALAICWGLRYAFAVFAADYWLS